MARFIPCNNYSSLSHYLTEFQGPQYTSFIQCMYDKASVRGLGGRKSPDFARGTAGYSYSGFCRLVVGLIDLYDDIPRGSDLRGCLI